MTWSGRGVRQSRRRFIRRRLCPDVLGENTDHQPFINRSLVEDIGCDALDRVPQRQELRLPCDALGTFYASEFIDGGVTDLALDGHIAVQHREPEREAFVVVSYYSVSRQRHRTASSKRQKENCEERARGADHSPNAPTRQKLAEAKARLGPSYPVQPLAMLAIIATSIDRRSATIARAPGSTSRLRSAREGRQGGSIAEQPAS